MKSLILLAFLWFAGESPPSVVSTRNADPVVGIAVDMMSTDLEELTGVRPVLQRKGEADIRIIQYDREKAPLTRLGVPAEIADSLAFVREAFYIGVHDGKLLVVGSDARGTAYGVLEISRLAGVSPWVWWGDSHIERKDRLEIPENYSSFQHPSIEYRGIFINDEDWAFRPWSTQTYSPRENPETISADTYRQIFRLLLRLRANTLWPAMHPGTTPFFKVEGAAAAADSCAILIGTSHCEPLLRSNTGEWDVEERGPYNYITNKEAVLDYWTERLVEMKGRPGLYTIGMRGIHDGSMEGVHTLEEKTEALQRVIYDQRELLRQYIDRDISSIPQMFMPYKEVLQIMENGLDVPDDVTIVWCDDNYGYMTRLSDEQQQKRSGGAGVYYHLSYCGQPHDHLWLSTVQPGLIYHEMMQAYNHNVRKLWIANVHDPKIASYNMEFFLDLAWNVNSIWPDSIDEHLNAWLTREYGEEAAAILGNTVAEYYRLASIRKPEFMGWSQVELRDRSRYPLGLSKPVDTEFSFSEFGNEAQRYIDSWRSLRGKVAEAADKVPEKRMDSYYASVMYPVYAAGYMAEKMLYAQLSRSRAKTTYAPGVWKTDSLMMAAAALSQKAYQSIRELTRIYNEDMSGGKWKGNMSDFPRSLYVFWSPDLPVSLNGEEIELWAGTAAGWKAGPVTENGEWIAANACDFSSSSEAVVPVQNLGHSGYAVPVSRGESLEYSFESPVEGKAVLRVALIPTQALDRGEIRFSVSLDGGEEQVFSLKEPYRSERWKINVSRQQAVVEIPVEISTGTHSLTLKAIDDHIIFDQWMIDSKPGRKFYLFPLEAASR